MKAVGIDIGTTTICGVLMDGDRGGILDARTLPNDTVIEAGEGRSWEHLQDPERILEKCRRILGEYRELYQDIGSVGVTGQMHGILYVDREGKAVSPLYTWQDRRGDLPFGGPGNSGVLKGKTAVADNGDRFGGTVKTYAEELTEKTGYVLATGFGLVTHYYHVRNGLVPVQAVTLCTIPDYVGMSLAGGKRPLLHQSMAASLGLYDLEHSCFDKAALQKAGIDEGFLPEITRGNRAVGCLADLSPAFPCQVSVALGDNQASFLGSVGPEEKLLLNVGTGSQISTCSERLVSTREAECRPYLEETWLIAGSPLCGGYAYSLLKRFVEEIFALDGTAPAHSVYELLNRAARRVYEQKEKEAQVDTRFNGSRGNPSLTGSIHNLTESTFHLGQFALGTLKGICDELYRYYEEFPEEVKRAGTLVGSGNGIRMNPLLQEICRQRFGMEMKVPLYSEEAGYGAALFSLLASGYYESLDAVRRLIRYE